MERSGPGPGDWLYAEDLSQLEFELSRAWGRDDAEALERAADELLTFRCRWLIPGPSGSAWPSPWLSRLEYGRFVSEASISGEADGIGRGTVGERLKPAAGIGRRTAGDFCAWLSARTVRAGEPLDIRLPTAAQAGRPVGTEPGPPRLEALFGGEGMGCWCADMDRLAGSRPPGAQAAAARLLPVRLRLDAWFLFRLGMWHWLEASMPVRETDWDFNENYERDRRYVERYATGLRIARDALVELDSRRSSGLDLAGRLDFDPLHNLRGLSPLDSQRDQIVAAFVAFRAGCASSPGGDSDFLPGLPELEEAGANLLKAADQKRLEAALEGLGARGAEPEGIAGRLAFLLEAGAGAVMSTPGLRGLQVLQRQLAAPGTESERDQASGQWRALIAWALSGESAFPPANRRRRWFRRRPEPPRSGPREALAALYVDLTVLAERRLGRSEPFEGIRLATVGGGGKKT